MLSDKLFALSHRHAPRPASVSASSAAGEFVSDYCTPDTWSTISLPVVSDRVFAAWQVADPGSSPFGQ